MARRKFQVGDKVKVVKDMCIGGDYHSREIGEIGKIVEYQREHSSSYPYEVKFRKGKAYSYESFNAKELEKVESK